MGESSARETLLNFIFAKGGCYDMNARRMKFCDEYLIDCNATQAAIRAGYSPRTAYSQGQRLLKKAEVKAYINQQMALLSDATIADAQEVLNYLTSVMRGEHTDQTLQLIGGGAQKIANIAVPKKDRLKAAELIGKRHGLFKDNVSVEGAIPVVVISGGDQLED